VSTRKLFVALGAGALLAIAAPATAASAATPVPLPVGPDIAFSGLVNGVSSGAPVQVGCFGPIVVGETGHPLAGQTLEVVTGTTVSAGSGYTGSAADLIDVFFGPAATSAAPAAVFNSFFVAEPIPTSILVPCYGTGTVSFVPVPTSATARTATVSVTFESQP
jgi:hypothetical protein